jgi:formate C-acetyltransferase
MIPDILEKKITLAEPSLQACNMTERVEGLKKAYFNAMPEVCIDRAVLVTKYSKDNNYFAKAKITILEKARLYRYVLENQKAVVVQTEAYEQGKGKKQPVKFTIEQDSLFAGSTTNKFKGVPLYPEFMALALWPELWSMSTRKSNPLYLNSKDAERLNFEVFPEWMNSNITELAREKSYGISGEKKAPEMSLMELLVFFIDSKPNCISHTIPDLTKAIDNGLRSVIDEAKAKATAVDGGGKEFYLALVEVLEGVVAYSNNLADEAARLAASESGAARKQELLTMAAIYKKVPEHPAQTFREGLTTLWVCWMALHIENANTALSLGRMDQFLFELYQKDIASGELTVDGAVELLCCLWLKIGDHVPCIPEAGEKLFGGTGSNQAITIGGVDGGGNDAVNDLTYVMLRSIEMMGLRDPNLNARYMPGVSDEGDPEKTYLKRLAEVNVNTGATPAVHNDRAIIAALTRRGESLEDARDYGIIGCVEPVSVGKTYGHTGAVLLNLTSALEMALFNGRHRHTGSDRLIGLETGALDSLTTFDELKAAFTDQARWLIKQAVTLNNIYGKTHQEFYPTPIMSALFVGPMESGKDVIDGGAEINSSGAAIIGLADVADSLSAIEEVVYNQKKHSLSEVVDAIKGNFEGYDDIHKSLLEAPKYGNNNEQADGNVTFIIKLMEEIFSGHENYRGGNYRVGYWTMTNHAGFGRMMGATPNGRKARDNFTSGITPVSGVTPSLTDTLRSVADMPVEYVSSGMAFNIKYTPDGDKAETIDYFTAYMETYFEGTPKGNGKARPGGMEIQFNVTSHDTFIKAVENPQDYKELLVRVSGYTAYFKDLNPQMQMEIINRTEYNLKSDKAVQYKSYKLPRSQKCPIG